MHWVTLINGNNQHMKLLFFILFFVVPSALAQAPQLKPVVCMNTTVLLQILTEQGQELPKWIGQGDVGDTSQTTILVNSKTKAWTIVQFEKELACILSSGINGREIFHGPKV